jgi:hypothetical protein
MARVASQAKVKKNPTYDRAAARGSGDVPRVLDPRQGYHDGRSAADDAERRGKKRPSHPPMAPSAI